MSPAAPRPEDSDLAFLAGRRRGLWLWPAVAGALLALEAAFLLWILQHYDYLLGCWKVMREMELSALEVPVWQTLSIMLPLWLVLGIITHNLIILLIFRVYFGEGRYLRMLSDARRL